MFTERKALRLAGLSLGFLLGFFACADSTTPPPAAVPGPASGSAGSGGTSGPGPAAGTGGQGSLVDASTPGTGGAAAAGTGTGGATQPGDGAASDMVAATDAAAVDSAPALGAFPLEKVKAARAELHAATGGHIEGPSWRDGEIFFSTIPGGIYRVNSERKVSRHLALSSNGTFLLGDGSLLVCDERQGVLLLSRDGKVGVLGTASNGKCNDLTVDRWGNIYFSDFVNAVTMITPAGQQRKVLTLNKPNGLDVDPDSKYLYILPRPSDIYRVALSADGPMGMPEKIGQLEGVTDGCAFDAWGNLWASVYYGGQVSVFDPVSKQVLAKVGAGGSGLTNVTFGGPDRDTIFTTVDGKGIFRVPVGVKAFPGHPGAAQYTVKSYLDLKPLDGM